MEIKIRKILSLSLVIGTIFPVSSHSQGRVETLQRVDVKMSFHWKEPAGSATVIWSTLKTPSSLSSPFMKISLAGFLYARTIVNHAETRLDLLKRTQSAAVRLLRGSKEFELGEWNLDAGGRKFKIYPWRWVAAEEIKDARTYTARLIQTPNGSLGGHLEMAQGLERILAPAAPLIVFTKLSQELNPTERILLGRVIFSINDFYSRKNLSDTRSLIGSEILITATLSKVLMDEYAATQGSAKNSKISTAEFKSNSYVIAKKMGALYELQRACGLRSNVSPDRTAGLFINYMTESEVQEIMEHYAAGMKTKSGKHCNKPEVSRNLIDLMPEMRSYINSARPFMKKW